MKSDWDPKPDVRARWSIVEDEALRSICNAAERLTEICRRRERRKHRQWRKDQVRNMLRHSIWAVGEARTGRREPQKGHWFWAASAHKAKNAKLSRDHVLPIDDLLCFILEKPALFLKPTKRLKVWLRNACAICIILRCEKRKFDGRPLRRNVLPSDADTLPEIERVMACAWERYSEDNPIVYSPHCLDNDVIVPQIKSVIFCRGD